VRPPPTETAFLSSKPHKVFLVADRGVVKQWLVIRWLVKVAMPDVHCKNYKKYKRILLQSHVKEKWSSFNTFYLT
jgi:hypothetical protein